MIPIDLNFWERASHFNFFQSRNHPQVGITFTINIKRLFYYRKKLNSQLQEKIRLSDTLYYCIMKSANSIQEFKTRLIDRKPVQFTSVDAAFTYIPMNQNLHANCIATFEDDYSLFRNNISIARKSADINPTLTPIGGESQGLIYLSDTPDIHFTSLTNPWGDPWVDSVPRIAFGKAVPEGNALLLPISVEALHSFIDGTHLSKFATTLQSLAEEPETIIYL